MASWPATARFCAPTETRNHPNHEENRIHKALTGRSILLTGPITRVAEVVAASLAGAGAGVIVSTVDQPAGARIVSAIEREGGVGTNLPVALDAEQVMARVIADLDLDPVTAAVGGHVDIMINIIMPPAAAPYLIDWPLARLVGLSMDTRGSGTIIDVGPVLHHAEGKGPHDWAVQRLTTVRRTPSGRSTGVSHSETVRSTNLPYSGVNGGAIPTVGLLPDAGSIAQVAGEVTRLAFDALLPFVAPIEATEPRSAADCEMEADLDWAAEGALEEELDWQLSRYPRRFPRSTPPTGGCGSSSPPP